MVHLIDHLYHNLTDLYINLRDISPRNIHTIIPFQTAIISENSHENILSTENSSNSSNSGLSSIIISI